MVSDHPLTRAAAPTNEERWHHGPYGSMRYQVMGPPDGMPLLLVHGFGSLLEHWMDTMPTLATTMRCYALDLYGLGYSAMPRITPNTHLWGEQLAYFAEHVVGQPTVLVANSLGGSAALAAARLQPAWVRALVLVDTTGLAGMLTNLDMARSLFIAAAGLPMLGETMTLVMNGKLGVQAFLHGLYYRQSRVRPALVAALAGPFGRPSTARLCLHMIRNLDDLTVPIARGDLTMPTLLVWGERDPLLPVRFATIVRDELLPHADIVTIPASGHCPFDETPQAFLAAVQPWLHALAYQPDPHTAYIEEMV